MTEVRGKPDKLGQVIGADLIGCAVNAPYAQYEKVETLKQSIEKSQGTSYRLVFGLFFV